jgi:hypothetical protein
MNEIKRNAIKYVIRTWLEQNPRIVVNEREDDKFYFSYWVWPSNRKGKDRITPILIGHQKQLQQEHEWMFLGWAWKVDFKHHYVKKVMNDTKLRGGLVSKLKQIINHQFRIQFLPNDDNFTVIKVRVQFLVESISRELLSDTIKTLWLKYATVFLQFEKQCRWPGG